MKNLTFKEIGKDGKENRKVSITQEQADNFNSTAKRLGKAKSNANYFIYELVKGKK